MRYLYNIARTKGAKVADSRISQGNFGVWDPNLVKTFNHWELGEFQQFMETKYSKKIFHQIPDKLKWKGDTSGSFTVKAYYADLEGDSLFHPPINLIMEQNFVF